nr:S1 family peptidase [Mycobacterium avium]
MTIVQGSTKCTLGYVDTTNRIAYSAGHCDSDHQVRDTAGTRIGNVLYSHTNHDDQPNSGPRDTVIDYEAISLDAAAGAVTNLLGPAFTRPLITQPGLTPQPGMPVCHHGATTGRSCGLIAEVYHGWFTIDPGRYDLTSDHGDSGGPVYTYTRASGVDPVLIGIFRGRHGHQLAAVSWPDTQQQAGKDAAATRSIN